MALIALLVNHPGARSQTPEQPSSIQRYEWRVFTVADSHLPGKEVRALSVGADGALWVGTGESVPFFAYGGKFGGGLARFHEGAWQVFTAANSDLPDDNIRALSTGVDGALWVGTGGGLARFQEGAWQVFTAANSDLPSNDVWALSTGADGALWVGTNGGVARFHEGSWQVFTAANSGLPDSKVRALNEGADGTLWVGYEQKVTVGGLLGAYVTGGGLARFHEGAWQVFTTANSDLPSNDVQALSVGADGALWIGTGRSRSPMWDPESGYAGGLARFHEDVWQVFTAANSDLPNHDFRALSAGADGTLWVGTGGGLALVHEGAWQVFSTANSGLPDDNVWALNEGADGALWVGTGDGLARLHESAWQVFSRANSDLPDDNVWALNEGADGALWVGTGDGLARLHESAWPVLTKASSDLPSTSNDVRALTTGADGTLWVGTGDTYIGGLARFHEGVWEVFTKADSDLPSNTVRALTTGADGALWVGTDGGLARFHEDVWQIFTKANSDMPSNAVRALTAGADGALWVGTGDGFSGGLARFHEGAWQVFTAANSGLPDDDVGALNEGSDGGLWVGTDGGLARFHEGAWQVFTAANSDLPDNKVRALSAGADGALWVGTEGGLARFLEGAWQVFTTANSDLPDNKVRALSAGADGILWVGTAGHWVLNGAGFGLARFDWTGPKPRLSKIETLAEIHQSEHTFAVRGFDPAYRTPLRYNWTVLFDTEVFLTRRTSEPYLAVPFGEDGFYTVKVQASDRNGWLSNTETFEVDFALPSSEEQPWWRTTTAKVGVAAIPLLYLVLLLPLISLYPRFSWVRSVVNSGVFTKFPVMHRLLLSTSWARRRLFALYRTDAVGASDIRQYIDQSVFPLSGGKSLPIGQEEDPFGGLAKLGRFSLVLGRSGTGKSILMMRVRRTAAARFGQDHADLPVLVNAPTHLATGETLAGAVKTVLRRSGKVELPDSILDFLIGKGGFLILVDSLNECPQAGRALTSFLNADASNTVIIASQTDVLHHPDVKPYRLAEVTVDQARSYLDGRVKAGTWDRLSTPLRALAQIPKDLDLIAEVIENLGVQNLPTRRADLYAERLKADTAVKAWVDTADPRIEILYALAWRMLAERRTPDLPTFAQWVKEELNARNHAAEEVDSVTEVLQRSRQFRDVKMRDRLGLDRDAIAFDHELVGKFLAARHVRAMLEGPSRAEALELAEDEAWQDVLFFVIDEAVAPQLPELLLDELIERSGIIPLALVAYAIKIKSGEQPPLPPEVRDRYSEARLREDVKLTPAA